MCSTQFCHATTEPMLSLSTISTSIGRLHAVEVQWTSPRRKNKPAWTGHRSATAGTSKKTAAPVGMLSSTESCAVSVLPYKGLRTAMASPMTPPSTAPMPVPMILKLVTRPAREPLTPMYAKYIVVKDIAAVGMVPKMPCASRARNVGFRIKDRNFHNSDVMLMLSGLHGRGCSSMHITSGTAMTMLMTATAAKATRQPAKPMICWPAAADTATRASVCPMAMWQKSMIPKLKPISDGGEFSAMKDWMTGVRRPRATPFKVRSTTIIWKSVVTARSKVSVPHKAEPRASNHFRGNPESAIEPHIGPEMHMA
mmetsp:Transcript_47362/g.144066  ORF Transcript_47362/g.144066 Transcript_47362/m.144066 type:complete len:311 (-) Transcript_47362:400-1332(-)